MSGGTWTNQNKALPGVYINVKSQGNLTSNVGSRGVVAIAKPLSWGAENMIQTIIPGEDTTPYIGYPLTSEKALFLREMMKGSDTTSGPSKILLYRLSGEDGAKASASIGTDQLTVTALYEGKRGNDITIIIGEDPDKAGVYEVSTVVDGSVADKQSVSNLNQLKQNSWVSFSGSGTSITETAGTRLTGGNDPGIVPDAYSDFLKAIEPYQFDILVYDGSDSTVIQAMAAFARRLSDNIGQKCQVVMAGADAAACDSEFVIAVANGVILDDGTVLTAEQATWWLGGAEAGALYNESLTYAKYPNAAEAMPKLTEDQAESAVRGGQICFIDTFGSVKVCTDINTLVSFTVDKGREFSKNRVMRVLMQFCNDVYEHFSDYFIGKVDNNDAGRNLLKGWIVGYLNEVQANNGIRDFASEDVSVAAGNDIDSVVINIAIRPVDSVEKIYMTVAVYANTATE